MAKTIKFNLILNGNPVRTVDDLKHNFSIEDVLEYHDNGLLQRWLHVRGYDEYLRKVNGMKFDSNISQIQQLIKIFEVECDDEKIKEGIAILEYIAERKLLLSEYRKSDYQARAVIDDYHSGYDAIVNDIIENAGNMSKIKAHIREVEENYMGLFSLNYRDLYNNLIVNAPLAIFAILMNDEMRSYFIPDKYPNSNTDAIYNQVKKLVANKSELKEKLGSELRVFTGNTEAYWKDIEPSEKRFMVVSMQDGNYVRSAGTFGEELSGTDINYNFLILSGIDYKSNNAHHELLYMEV